MQSAPGASGRSSIAAASAAPGSAAPGPAPSVADISRYYWEQIAKAEHSRVEQDRKMTRIAWRVAAGGIAAAVIAVVGSAVALTLKRPEAPVVIRQNTTTGAVDVIDVVRTPMKWGEVTDIAELRRYVEQRESYDWETIQSLYDSVSLRTCGVEQGRYTAQYDTSDPRSPLKVWKNDVRVIARSGAVTFVGTTAQVFFEKRYVALNGMAAPPVEYQVATISYEYRNSPVKRSQLEANPTGFCVQSYAVARDWTRTEQKPAQAGATGGAR